MAENNHIKAKENLFDDLIESEEKSIKKIQEKIDIFDGKKDGWVFKTLTKVLADKVAMLSDLRCCKSDLDYLNKMESEN